MNTHYKPLFHLCVLSLVIFVMVDVCISTKQLWRKMFHMQGEGDCEGLCFRNHSKTVAKQLGIHGYIQIMGSMMMGVVEGTEDQINIWSEKMFQGSYNTEHGVRILARAIKFDKIEAVTKYKYANFTIRKLKPIIDGRVFDAASERKIYKFTEEEIDY